MKEEFNQIIDILITSCKEGYTGDWDCTTDEGKERFLDMITLLEKLKA